MKKLLLLTTVVLSCYPGLALADGKFFSPEKVPPDLPYQRALIAHDGARELLILQSKFDGEAKDFGWVIPLPAVPELASMNESKAIRLFAELGWQSRPSETLFGELSIYALSLLLLALATVALTLLFYKFRLKRSSKRLISVARGLLVTSTSGAALILLKLAYDENHSWGSFYCSVMLIYVTGLLAIWGIRFCYHFSGRRSPKALATVSGVLSGVIIAIFCALLLTMLTVTYGWDISGAYKYAPHILKEQRVGIYDIKVVKGNDSKRLILWFNEHGYRFDEEDKQAFEDYIKRGWCFVTARVDLKKAEQEGFSSDEGLVNPLVMLFESEEIVYPLALTGTIGNEVVVLLYVFDSHKVTDSSGRFAIRFAGEREIESLKRHMAFEPEYFYEKWDFKQTFLTKLKATLTPGQMKEDLILQHAPDDEPYREHIYRW